MEIILAPGEPLLFRPSPSRTYKGLRLPGSSLHSCKRAGIVMHQQEVNDTRWMISLRHYAFASDTVFATKECLTWIRMEVVLTGALAIAEEGRQSLTLNAGHYHITNSSCYKSHFPPASECIFLIIYFSPAFTDSPDGNNPLACCRPRALTSRMNDLVAGLFNSSYREHLQTLFFENTLRAILFQHLARDHTDIPDSLSPKDYAAVLAADTLIAADLCQHHSIPSLSRQVGINEYMLKKGFRKVFNAGPYERLMQRRMKRACDLMENSHLPLKQISGEAGYTTYHGFTTRFRKRFGVTPSEWMRMKGER